MDRERVKMELLTVVSFVVGFIIGMWWNDNIGTPKFA